MATLDDVSVSIVDGPFGSSLKTSDYVDTGVPVLQGKNITGDSFVWKEVRYISDRKAQELKRSSVIPGDHLMIKIGSIGYSAIIDHLDGNEFAIIPANLARIRPDRSVIDDRYLHHWLKSEPTKRHFQSVASSTAQPALSLSKIRDAALPVPPLDEQRRIAAILDKADALRQKRKRAIALLDSLTQSIFLEMFGEPVLNTMGWPMASLGELEEFLTSGSRGWAKYYADNGRAFIRIQNLKAGILDVSDLAYVRAPDGAETRRTTVKKGDILISITADLGRVAVVPPELDGMANINQHLALFRPRGIDPTYLSQFLASAGGQRQFAAGDKGGVKAGLNFDDIRKICVLIPPETEQLKFAAIVGKLSARTATMQAANSRTDTLFASFQSRAFSGQL